MLEPPCINRNKNCPQTMNINSPSHLCALSFSWDLSYDHKRDTHRNVECVTVKWFGRKFMESYFKQMGSFLERGFELNFCFIAETLRERCNSLCSINVDVTKRISISLRILSDYFKMCLKLAVRKSYHVVSVCYQNHSIFIPLNLLFLTITNTSWCFVENRLWEPRREGTRSC